jgi:hypothetical protein
MHFRHTARWSLAAAIFSCSFFGVGKQAKADKINKFTINVCQIPKDEIRRGGPPKDGIPALSDPKVVEADQAGYLDAKDRVIGVVRDGKARAYPLRILLRHENVNDELAGEPIAVTYCPLCDSAVVFDRRIGGQVREFGISGLLYNSNVLLYDRQSDKKTESLWSQLLMKAVTGPAAEKGLEFKALPSELTTWGEWRKRHPSTTVLAARPGRRLNYGPSPYKRYFESDKLWFKVSPSIDESSGLKNKDRIVAVRAGDRIRAYPIKRVAEAVGSDGEMEDSLGSVTFRLLYSNESDTIRVEAVEPRNESFEVAYSFWFAWHAMHPEGEVYGSDRGN